MVSRRFPRFGQIMLLLCCAFVGSASTANAATLSASKPVRVLVAEDKTKEAECKQWYDSPDKLQPCPAGSVVFTRETTLDEVKARNIYVYVELADGQVVTEQIKSDLVKRIPLGTQPASLSRTPARTTTQQADAPAGTTATCLAQNGRSMGSNYLVDPNNANSTRVSFQVKYNVLSNCNVTSVIARSMVSTGQWQWKYSCLRDLGTNCQDHYVWMVTAWPSQWENESVYGSSVGAAYAHVSASPCTFCGDPYTRIRFT